MTALSIQVPFPVFQDRDGQPLDNGYVWIGTANLNPQTNPVVAYFDAALTIVAAQPLRTLNGYISNAGTPAQIYVDSVNFSILVQDSKGTMVYNFPDGTGISPNAAGVIYDPAGTGAVATTVQTKLRESVSVKDFGAVGDGVADDTAAIQAAIDATSSGWIFNGGSLYTGGGTVFIPRGIYVISSTLTMKVGVRLVGEGYRATSLKVTHTGAGIKMSSPINTSSTVNTCLENMQIVCTNAGNTDGGYVDVCGTYVYLFGVEIIGFKYGIIFDQTELATVRLCKVESQTTAGIWLVNGADYTVGTNPSFTNRITVQECQINQSATSVGIADDGGYTHSFYNNNFNGCLTHIRVAAINGLTIKDNEMESATSTCITFNTLGLLGTPKGSSIAASIEGNVIVPTVGQICINCVASVSPLVVIGNIFGNSAAVKISGLTPVFEFVEIGNYNAGGGATISGTPVNQFRSLDTSTFTPFTPLIAIGGTNPASQTQNSPPTFTRVGNVVTCSFDISLSTKGGLTGLVTITGLPYSGKTSLIQNIPVPLANGIVGLTSVSAFIFGVSSIGLRDSAINYVGSVVDTNISATTRIAMTFSYFAN